MSRRKAFTVVGLATLLALCAGVARPSSPDPEGQPPATEEGRSNYVLLATKKTSTMQKEMTEAAEAGYRFLGVMGGETAFGGSEVVVVMSKDPQARAAGRYEYKLLATSKTSTMEKELQEAGDAGFEFKGQTVFKTTFGGEEVVCILERDREIDPPQYEYKLLATNKTSTMQKELREAADAGFHFVGLAVAPTRFGGNELVVIVRRVVEQ